MNGCQGSRHFVLVHGACHGAWCWYKVQTLLKAAGHQVTAVDLGGAGINPKQLSDIRFISDVFEPLFSLLGRLKDGEKVILVGHSKGGLAIGAATEKFPEKISVGVYLSAYMLTPNFTILDLNRKYNLEGVFLIPENNLTFDEDGRVTSFLFSPDFVLRTIYAVSPIADWNLATLLMRPYPYFDDERGANELTLTERRFGSVKRVFIKLGQDAPQLAEIFIPNGRPDEVYEIPEADHMAMSSQPQELTSILQEIGSKYS